MVHQTSEAPRSTHCKIVSPRRTSRITRSERLSNHCPRDTRGLGVHPLVRRSSAGTRLPLRLTLIESYQAHRPPANRVDCHAPGRDSANIEGNRKRYSEFLLRAVPVSASTSTTMNPGSPSGASSKSSTTRHVFGSESSATPPPTENGARPMRFP